jgi:hypothetical protein
MSEIENTKPAPGAIVMSALNVPLNELATTEGMDFSHRGTPLKPQKPEHYVNKQYVDDTLVNSGVRSQAVVTVTCDGIATTYPVPHGLNTTNIASVQMFNITGGAKTPIHIAWEPASANAITLKPDVLLPVTMSLLVIVTS